MRTALAVELAGVFNLEIGSMYSASRHREPERGRRIRFRTFRVGQLFLPDGLDQRYSNPTLDGAWTTLYFKLQGFWPSKTGHGYNFQPQSCGKLPLSHEMRAKQSASRMVLSSLTRPSICRSCRLRVQRHLSSLHSARQEKPYFVTTPIFYVNAGK